jgi:hypothetical protein
MRVVLEKDVEIQGVPYAVGQDISSVDSGAIESLLGMKWARRVHGDIPHGPFIVLDEIKPEVVEPVPAPQPVQRKNKRR